MIYRIVWSCLRVFFRLVLRWRIRGAGNVPPTGPVILASNHVSNLDPPAVCVGIWRPCHFMAKEELFVNPLFAWFIRQLNAFPVKRGTADRASLKRAVEILAEGEALVMFPEGTRSETGELQAPEMGVGMIVYRSGAPVVPVYVDGTTRVMPRGGGFHSGRIGVTYGKPICFPVPEGRKPGREEYVAATNAIMAAIAELRDGLMVDG